jgi:hypothetical protein
MLLLDKLTSKGLFIITIFSFGLISCERPDAMSDYYFPISELEDGLVYQYESVNQPDLPKENWFYKTLVSDRDTFLAGQFYSPSGRVQQLIVERQTDLGIVQDSLILFQEGPDSTDIPVPATVAPSAVFPYYKNTDEDLIYKIVWTDPADSLQYTLKRKKRYIRDTVWVMDAEELPAVVFSLQEELETFRADMGATESTWSGMEIYARGIGLVYYTKEISPEYTKAYRLKNRYAMDFFLEELTKY